MADGLAPEIAMLADVGDDAVTVIPDPALTLAQVDAHDRRQGDIAPLSGRHFVTMARLARQKNLPLLLRAFRAGARPGDRLTIFGDGPERSSLVALADTLGLSGGVAFAGHVADPFDHIGPDDIFLLSSDYEGVPAVILEALAAGLRIIATRSSLAMAGLLEHGNLGRLTAPGDVAAFAAAIADDLPPQKGTAAAAQARRHIIENAAPAYLACFATVAQQHHAAHPDHRAAAAIRTA